MKTLEKKLMTEELKNHAKQLNEGKISEEQYAKAVLETQKQLAANKQEQTQLSDAIRTSEKVIKNQITQQNLADDSIKALRAQLSNLTKEYDELVRIAKRAWLEAMGLPIDHFHGVAYGATKADSIRRYIDTSNGETAVLFDDNAKVREGWHLGEAIDPIESDILDFLRGLVG